MTTFLHWLTQAPAGASTIYYRGCLVDHRGRVELVPQRADPTPELVAASIALEYALSGHLNLVQRAAGPRNSKGIRPYDYIAQRTSKTFVSTQ